ncbi:MAG: hypothetical protein CSA29_06300 [Desulfobacterales bacterium]|nr:MAG: hypothetical protein CSA29_06300 [Desulfobacterales bacterium]
MTIALDTKGYGGRQISKRILVNTNDPAQKKRYLTFSGKVIRIVEIKPSVVSLSGRPGESLSAKVTITPSKSHDMKILGMTQQFNTNIKADLVAPKNGERQWTVNINAFSDKADDFYEILTLKTDNPLKPKLKIRVYAIYMDEIKSKS